jgi:hypothetical protein
MKLELQKVRKLIPTPSAKGSEKVTVKGTGIARNTDSYLVLNYVSMEFNWLWS